MGRRIKKCILDYDVVNPCTNRKADADRIIIGSPTYFADVSTDTKVFIGRAWFVGMANSGLYAWKVGAVVVAVRRTAGIHVPDTVNHFFGISNLHTVGSSYWNTGPGHKPGDVEDDRLGSRTMKSPGATMTWIFKKSTGKNNLVLSRETVFLPASTQGGCLELPAI